MYVIMQLHEHFVDTTFTNKINLSKVLKLLKHK